MGIFALRDIPLGEEITYDYQFEHSGLAAAANAYRYASPARRLLDVPWSSSANNTSWILRAASGLQWLQANAC